MKTRLFFMVLLVSTTVLAQRNHDYMLVRYDTTGKQKFGYVFTNQKGDTLTRLDTAKYYVCFSDTIEYFAIVGIRQQPGWWAIDKNEQPLFRVYSTSRGEPSPDNLREGMIRIVDEQEKIGYANNKGEIVIRPQYEAASSFYRGKAIIGRRCQQTLWCCKGEQADKHYAINCRQVGYINRKGQLRMLGNQTFEEVEKKIGWKSE